MKAKRQIQYIFKEKLEKYQYLLVKKNCFLSYVQGQAFNVYHS